MKSLLVIAALFTLPALFAQTQPQPIRVKIKGNVFNIKIDSVKVAHYFGASYVDYLRGAVDKDGNFSMEGELPYEDYYVIRFGTQHLNVIMRDTSKIGIYTDGRNINAFHNIVGSDESVALNEFINNMQAYNAKRDSANAYLQRFPEQQAAVSESFQSEYYRFTSYRQQFIANNPNSPALLPVISTLDLEKEFSIYETVVSQLIAGFPNSPTIQNTYAQFEQQKKQRDAMNFLAAGKAAPNFVQNDANGLPIALADLKGKVVLIDFWASWCGPCRKENPNVVALYNKYKDKGFTVLSVSLDNNKDAWLAAIQKDKLSWPYHVSDLRGWQNEAAKQYMVTGIPFTVLVDQQGNIINTKLRGPDLERTLISIFGF